MRMAVMGTLPASNISEGNGQALSSLQQLQNSIGDQPRPVTSFTSVKTTVKRENPNTLNGPSPKKGSGQDRFRQILSGTPTFTDMFSSASRNMAENAQIQSSFPSTGGPVYGPFYPNFQQVMHNMNQPTGSRVAVNPAVYPEVASIAQSMPQSPMPVFNGDANRDMSRHGGVHDQFNGSNGVATLSNAMIGPTWTSQLSAECQRRHFNPQFKEWSNADGTFQCSVELQGVTLSDSRTWRFPADAKQALARRAVDYIRQTPVHGGLSIRERERAQVIAEEKSKNQAIVAEQQEERRLLDKIQKLYGMGAGPSESVMANPAASRAFLEGFALGSKLRDSSRSQRRRSRSPIRNDRGRGRRGSRDSHIKRE